VQSLIVTCRLHGIDVYTYLVDVLQRVGHHPASRVAELTPRQWSSASPPTRCAQLCTFWPPRPYAAHLGALSAYGASPGAQRSGK
jgi:hypothetical protein